MTINIRICHGRVAGASAGTGSAELRGLGAADVGRHVLMALHRDNPEGRTLATCATFDLFLWLWVAGTVLLDNRVPSNLMRHVRHFHGTLVLCQDFGSFFRRSLMAC
jgi:hypothetical protein